ncbi:MAG TPA: MG2 domain-containing protein [Pyrinomonadaceae bacterium]|jgi:hypothetical protein
MRRRRWVIVVFCLSVSLPFLSQLSSASGTLRVDESITRLALDEQATIVSLAVVNPLGHEFRARVRLEVLDTLGEVRASLESDETIKRGASTLRFSLPLQLAGLDKQERKRALWYRLRYRISPEQPARASVGPIEGIVSLSEITPDFFELRVTAPSYAREGVRYHAFARAVHPISGRPVPGVKVEARIALQSAAKDKTLKAFGLTNAEGNASLDFDLPQHVADNALELTITGSRGALVEEVESEVQLDRETLILISTDKPLYQPGQMLHLRALIFDATKRALPRSSATLLIDDPEGTTVFRAPLLTSRFGIASLDWAIPENTRLGDYIINIKLDEQKYEDQQTSHIVKVSRYDLPNFAVSVKPDRAYYLRGQDAEVEVRADYLFGQPVKRGRVRLVREKERRWDYSEQKWETEEAETYEGETNPDGRFLARLNLQKEHARLAGENDLRYQDLTYAAYFTDPTTNRTEQRRFDLRLTKDAIHIYIFEGIEYQTKNFPLQFYLSTFYADGTPAECEVSIKEAADEDKAFAGQHLRTVKTNRYGVAKINGLALPRSDEEKNRASLALIARDRKGALGHQAHAIWYTNQPVIRIETNKSIYRAGESIKAVIHASEPLMKLIVEVWKNRVVLRSETIELHDGRATLNVPYSAEFKDGVTLAAYAAPDYAVPGVDISSYDWPTAARQVIYPRERDLRLDVKLGQQTYRPGEEAHVDFRVSAPDGRPIESALGVVVFDKAVEERARTDREFGSSYGFYEAYNHLSGYLGELSGVSGKSLMSLDLTKAVPADLELVAEIMLRTYVNAPRILGGESYERRQPGIFTKLIEQQTAVMKAVLGQRYLRSMEYPQDEARLRALLSAGGIDLDKLLDPWGTPYRPRFSIERELDVLEFVSAGADKRFATQDDFTGVRLNWAYFRPHGETINRAVANYHARTGEFIRDAATLKTELRSAGVDIDALRDRWGQPYRFDFVVVKTNHLINITSNGPDEKTETGKPSSQDDFTIWTCMTDYFVEHRSEIDKALIVFARKTERFPQDTAELREALGQSNINLDGLRDPWGRNYYATFSSDARYTDRPVIRSYSRYGEAGKLRQEITPVIQRINHFHLRSSGADGTQGTPDDFSVADFSRILTEQTAIQAHPQPARPVMIYSGATGAVSGTIVDMEDRPIAGVKVTATHLGLSREYVVSSDDEGRYLLLNLPVGLYHLEFTASGFSTSIVEQVPIHSSNTTRLDVRMLVGAVTEAVTITDTSSAQVQTTESASVSYSVARTVINNVGTRVQNSTPRLREYFPETLVWQPSLETDREGRAQLDFKLADNITTWKMAVVGSNIDGEVGLVEREFQAFQPFFVEHEPPRILTEGDEIQLPVVVRNYLDKAQDVNLQIAPSAWFTLLGPSEKRVVVPAGDSARQTFDFRASASVHEGKQQITARADGDGDAIVKPVSVHPDGEERASIDSQIIADAATLNLNLPANTIKNSARAELRIYPNLMAHVFESIEAILQRPYGCGEQTISSTYPSLLALIHDRRTGNKSPVAPKALRYLRAGYERLLNYRTQSGGFSYWSGHGEPDLALTAYALKFLNEARAFIAVDETIINSARDWLIAQQQPDGSWPARYAPQGDSRPNALLTAYVARVLAATNAQTTNAQSVETQSKPADEDAAPSRPKTTPLVSLQRALSYLALRIDEVDEPYLMASYALAAQDAGDTKNAARAVAKLRALVREERGASFWALEINTPFYGWGRAGRIETTALVVQALASDKQANDDALVNRGLLFLLRQKDRYGVWYSTQATINVLNALITLLAGEGHDNGPTALAASGDAREVGPIEVVVGGRHVASVPMPPGNQLANPIAFDLSPFLAPGENRIELRRDGKTTRASVQAVATYYVPWSTERDNNHPSTAAEASGTLKLKLGFDKSTAGINEEVTCKVLAERVGHAGYGMLLGEIGLPPGADVDRASLEKAMKESGWAFSRYDILPDRLIVYLWPHAGGTSFEFKFRPRYGLTAQTAPSQLYDYYNPEAKTVVAPTKFVVK